MLDKYAPLKHLLKKNKKKTKPLVTSGIQKSTKIRDKLYKQIIKSKTTKTAKFETYRKSCNKTTDLLRISGQSYYQIFFEQSKNNSKILWQGINNIIYYKKNKQSTNP